MPDLKINTDDYQIKDIKLAVNQNNIKALIFADGNIEIDITNDYSSCELKQGLHFLLWGYYGSPNGAGDNAPASECFKIYDNNTSFIDECPEKSTTDAYDKFKDQFALIELPYLKHPKFNINSYVNGSGTELYASFFESKNNLIISNNYGEGSDNKGNIIVDHIFYSEYEIKDWDQNLIPQSGTDVHKLYNQIEINVVANVWNNSWKATIPRHETYKYCDVFITLFDNADANGDQQYNYLEINGKREELPFSFFDETFSFYYKLGLDATKDNIFEFFAGNNFYSIYKLKVIYYPERNNTEQSIIYKAPFVAPDNSASCTNDTAWFSTSKGYDLGLTKCIYDFSSFGCDSSKVQSIIETDLQAQDIFDTENYDYKEADWADLNLTVDEQKAMLETFGIDTTRTADVSIGWCTYNGNECYSSDRHYYASFHNYVVPSYYLVHAYYNNHYIDLGSWHDTRKFIIKRTKKG